MALKEMYRAGCDDEIRAVLEMREKSRRDEISRLYNAEKRGKEEEFREDIKKEIRKKKSNTTY